MPKTHTTLSIDTEILRAAKTRFPNQISGILERTLENMMTMVLPSAEGKTMDEIMGEIQRTKEELDTVRATHESWRQKKDLVEREIEKKRKEDLDIKTRIGKGIRASGEMRELSKDD